MMSKIIQCLLRERKYTLMLFVILAVYFYAGIAARLHPEKDSAANQSSMDAFKDAEDRFQEKIRKDPQRILREDRSAVMIATRLFTAGFVGMFLLGMALGMKYLISKPFRQRLRRDLLPHPCAVDWKFSLFYKAAVLFLMTSIVLSVVLGILEKFVPIFTHNMAILSHTLIADTACIFIVLYLIKKAGGCRHDVGFSVPEKGFWHELKIGFWGYAAVLPLFLAALWIVMLVAKNLFYEPDPHPLVGVFLEEESSPWMIAYSLFLAVLAGPFLEELFFRGFAYRIFRELYGAPVGMVLSASIFSAIHASVFAFWPIFVLGLILAYLYEIRRSLIAPWILHVLHNGFFITYFFLMKALILKHGGA